MTSKTLSTLALAVALALSMISPALAAGDATINSPSHDDIILADTLHLSATYAGTSTSLNWAVRVDTCEPGGVNKVAEGPNVTDDLDDVIDHSYVNGEFTASVDVSGWDDGTYCFIFNPGAPNDGDRDAVSFALTKSARTKDACKDGGWQTFGDYRNQGDCVSEYARAK